MAKRELTAREAKKNPEPFGYKGPAKWASIDAFVEANPRSMSAVKANKGAFVQRRSGFSNGGFNAQYDALKRSFDSGHITLQQFAERVKSISPVESTTLGTPEADARMRAQAKAQGVTTVGQIDTSIPPPSTTTTTPTTTSTPTTMSTSDARNRVEELRS